MQFSCFVNFFLQIDEQYNLIVWLHHIDLIIIVSCQCDNLLDTLKILCQACIKNTLLHFLNNTEHFKQANAQVKEDHTYATNEEILQRKLAECEIMLENERRRTNTLTVGLQRCRASKSHLECELKRKNERIKELEASLAAYQGNLIQLLPQKGQMEWSLHVFWNAAHNYKTTVSSDFNCETCTLDRWYAHITSLYSSIWWSQSISFTDEQSNFYFFLSESRFCKITYGVQILFLMIQSAHEFTT